MGKTRIGETLQAKVEDANGANSIRYQWFANGKSISSATGSTLALNASHVGKQISVQANYTDRSGNHESPISDYSPAVMNKPAPLPNYNPAAGQPTVSISGAAVVKEGQKAVYTSNSIKTRKKTLALM